jgi:predicted RND superfamily exporter protein
MNGATRSFGLAAAAGEITTVLAAVLFLPSMLFWMMKRKKA